MTLHYEWLGLVSSFVWAIAFLVAIRPVNKLGSIAFNRWRMMCSSLILGGASLFINGYEGFTLNQIFLMSLSGAVGICAGDVALFACFNRLGPRLSGLLFSSHAFFSLLIGIFVFGETTTIASILGTILIFSGISITLYFSEEKKRDSNFAVSKISVPIAVSLGIFAGMCQALGIAIAKPVVESGVNPIAASSIRMICAFLLHMLFWLCFRNKAKAQNKVTGTIFGLIFFNAFLALGIGMTLVLIAVNSGNIGLVSILSSCQPIMILPIMWILFKKTPQTSSWIAAIFVVIGTSIILTLH